jgi:hypothetical protein
MSHVGHAWDMLGTCACMSHFVGHALNLPSACPTHVPSMSHWLSACPILWDMRLYVPSMSQACPMAKRMSQNGTCACPKPFFLWDMRMSHKICGTCACPMRGTCAWRGRFLGSLGGKVYGKDLEIGKRAKFPLAKRMSQACPKHVPSMSHQWDMRLHVPSMSQARPIPPVWCEYGSESQPAYLSPFGLCAQFGICESRFWNL